MIEQFVKQLLEQKQLPENLEPEVYDKLVSDLTTRVGDLINKRIIESLNDEQLTKFEQIIDNNPEDVEGAQKFIEENVQNKEQITTAALMEFRDLYLGTS